MGKLAGQSVTVLGAGVAGLAVARALALRGAEVTVLEQAGAIREVGAGLQVTPNGAAVLRALGLGGALDAVTTRARAVELRDGYSGRVVLRMDLAALRPGLGWHLTHRADLIALLAEGAAAAGVQIRTGQKVARADLSAALPLLHMASGDTLEPAILIGADGFHSGVRRALSQDAAPFFTGQVAWRAVIAEVPGTEPVAEIHLGAGRHLVSYPLRGGALRNIVAVEERASWAAEGWNLPDDPENLRRAFAGYGPRVQGWLGQVRETWLWGLFRHPVAESWGKASPGGFAAVLGDAAHPTLPFLAQGANMALEDAWVLARALDDFGPGQAALAAYQSARIGRCRRIIAAANSNARAYHLSGITRRFAHLGLRIGGIVAPGAGLARYDWIYQADVTRT